MSDIKCPYCDHFNYDPEPFFRETDTIYIYDSCEKCNKTFGYKIDYSTHYFPRELPCANGEKHGYEVYIDRPESPYILYKCKYCEQTENIKRTES